MTSQKLRTECVCTASKATFRRNSIILRCKKDNYKASNIIETTILLILPDLVSVLNFSYLNWIQGFLSLSSKQVLQNFISRTQSIVKAFYFPSLNKYYSFSHFLALYQTI